MKTVIFVLVLISMLLGSLDSLRAQKEDEEFDFLDDAVFGNYLKELAGLPAGERVKRVATMSQLLTLALGGNNVEYKPEPGRLVPPTVMIGGKSGWSPCSESEPLVARLFPHHEPRRKIADRVILVWRLWIHEAPGEALAWMAQRTSSTVPSVGDVVKLVASTERQPGVPLTKLVPKELWTKLYHSSNPCYKIVALEKCDSTTQSPEELLKLYRECLFQTFGYLQVRALEGIYRSKDYRPEVRGLLQEFLASSPVEDDGTLPPYPAHFRNPVEGATWLLAHMEKRAVDSPVPPPPTVASKASAAPAPPDSSVPLRGRAEEPLKSPYQIRFGTMEINADRSKNYIFRWEGHEEVFDTSVKTFLSSGGMKFPGLPNLKEAGVKTISGKVFKYSGSPPDVFFREFEEKHPGEVVSALVFEGYLDEELVLELRGRTPVCRVDIDDNGKTTTLWKNVPSQDDKALDKIAK